MRSLYPTRKDFRARLNAVFSNGLKMLKNQLLEPSELLRLCTKQPRILELIIENKYAIAILDFLVNTKYKR